MQQMDSLQNREPMRKENRDWKGKRRSTQGWKQQGGIPDPKFLKQTLSLTAMRGLGSIQDQTSR